MKEDETYLEFLIDSLHLEQYEIWQRETRSPYDVSIAISSYIIILPYKTASCTLPLLLYPEKAKKREQKEETRFQN